MSLKQTIILSAVMILGLGSLPFTNVMAQKHNQSQTKKAAYRTISSLANPKYIDGQGQKMLEIEKEVQPEFLKKDLRPKKQVEVRWYRLDWSEQGHGAPERSPGAGIGVGILSK